MCNSLSQSLRLCQLPRGGSLWRCRKLCRYAKGPISEGAVAVGDWGSLGGELPQSKPAALPAPSGRAPLAQPETLCFGWKACGSTPSVTACAVPAPPRGRLWHCRKVCRHHQSRPLGEGGCERSEQTEGVRLRGCIIPSSHFFYQSVTFRFMRFVVYYGQHGSPWKH